MSAGSFPGASASYGEGDELKSIPFEKDRFAGKASAPLLRDPGTELEDKDVPEYDYSAPTIFFHYSALFNSEGDFYAGAADLFKELHQTGRYRLCVVKPSFDETFRILSSKEEKMNTYLKQQIGNAQYGLLMPFSPIEELSIQEQHTLSIGFIAGHTNAIFIHPSITNPLGSLYENLSQERFPMHSIRFSNHPTYQSTFHSSLTPDYNQYAKIRYAFFNHMDNEKGVKKGILGTRLIISGISLEFLFILSLFTVCIGIGIIPPASMVILGIICCASFVFGGVLILLGGIEANSIHPNVSVNEQLNDFVAKNPPKDLCENETSLLSTIDNPSPSM